MADEVTVIQGVDNEGVSIWGSQGCQVELVMPPPVTYQIKMTDQLSYGCCGKMPNRFHRIMARLLLGWKIVPISQST